MLRFWSCALTAMMVGASAAASEALLDLESEQKDLAPIRKLTGILPLVNRTCTNVTATDCAADGCGVGCAQTVTTVATDNGTTTLQVEDGSIFSVGDGVVIARGLAVQESHVVKTIISTAARRLTDIFGRRLISNATLMFEKALTNAHPANTTVSVATTVTTTGNPCLPGGSGLGCPTTSSTVEAPAGSSTIQVADGSIFSIGDTIVIGRGTAIAETNQVEDKVLVTAGRRLTGAPATLTLAGPLNYTHPAGTNISVGIPGQTTSTTTTGYGGQCSLLGSGVGCPTSTSTVAVAAGSNTIQVAEGRIFSIGDLIVIGARGTLRAETNTIRDIILVDITRRLQNSSDNITAPAEGDILVLASQLANAHPAGTPVSVAVPAPTTTNTTSTFQQPDACLPGGDGIGCCTASLAVTIANGSRVLELSNTSCFRVGDYLVVGVGAASEELLWLEYFIPNTPQASTYHTRRLLDTEAPAAARLLDTEAPADELVAAARQLQTAGPYQWPETRPYWWPPAWPYNYPYFPYPGMPGPTNQACFLYGGPNCHTVRVTPATKNEHTAGETVRGPNHTTSTTTLGTTTTLYQVPPKTTTIVWNDPCAVTVAPAPQPCATSVAPAPMPCSTTVPPATPEPNPCATALPTVAKKYDLKSKLPELQTPGLSLVAIGAGIVMLGVIAQVVRKRSTYGALVESGSEQQDTGTESDQVPLMVPANN